MSKNNPGSKRQESSHAASSHATSSNPDSPTPESSTSESSHSGDTPATQLRGPHLWNVQATRDLLWMAIAISAVWLVFKLHAVTLPMTIAFVLAYLTDPVMRWLERQLKIPRVVTIGAFVSLFTLTMLGILAWLVPRIVTQLLRLIERLPQYAQRAAERIGFDESVLYSDTFLENARSDPQGVAQQLFGNAQQFIGPIGGALGSLSYLGVSTVLVLVLYSYFSWRFEKLPNFHAYLPASHREQIWQILRRIEANFAGFFRGQLLTSVFTGLFFAIGFAIIGVPYWFVAALVGGTLAIIPYGQASGPILACIMLYLDATTPQPDAADDAVTAIPWLTILLGPGIIYLITQTIETFILTPWIQSWSVRLHPIAVLLAIVGGGSFGGLLGMFFAIPAVASAKIVIEEVLLPRLKTLADAN